MTKTSKLIAGLAVVAGFGVAVLPLASYAVETKDVNLMVAVSDASGFETPTGSGVAACSSTALSLTPNTIGTSLGSNKCDIKVNTNKNSGYVLSVEGNNSGALNHDSTSDTIPVASAAYTGGFGTGSSANLANATSVSAYGFNVGKNISNYAENQTGYFAVPGGKTQVEATNIAGANTYTFSFGSTVAPSQVQGTYTGKFTITVE
jgi:hypothetical protein